MKDLYSHLGLAIAIPAAAYDADNTPAAVDLQGFHSALIEIAIGVGGITFSGTNKIEFVLTHSDDDVSYSNVTVDDLLGVASVTDGIIKALTSAHASPTVTPIGYIGNKRYLKLLADFSGTHGAATPIAATVIKGHADKRPVNT